MLIDGDLVTRLERSAAALLVDVSEVMVATGVPGAVRPMAVHDGRAIALGPGRYVNRLVGLAASELSEADFERVESYFVGAGVDPMIEVHTWASASLLAGLGDRGYRPLWTRNIVTFDLASTLPPPPPSITVRTVDDDLVATWQALLAEGNEQNDPEQRRISDEFALARYGIAGGTSYVAFVDGVPAGCGSLEIAADVGWVGGAATARQFRGRGVQAALLHHRIERARDAGCDLVAATAVPAGVSARNMSRLGFSLVATQTEFGRRRSVD